MTYRPVSIAILLLLFMTRVAYAADGYTLVFDEDVSKLVVNEHNQVTVRATESRSLTTCFELESSGDGEFYSSSKVLIGDKIKSNIPKNENGASNRNFFYMPTIPGEETFTLKTFLRPESVSTSCDTWVPDGEAWAVYETTMTVGVSAGEDEEEDEDDGGVGDTSTTMPTDIGTTETTTTSSGGVGGSAHSSSVALSTVTSEIPFHISAGRQRIATVGSLVQFDATVTKGGEFTRPHFRWSFGDGTEYVGESVSHAYALPGTYEVILNASVGDKFAVARTRISVSAPQVTLVEVDPMSGYAVFRNNAIHEVNLGGWEIRGNDSKFVFPADTIIRAGSNLPIAFLTMQLPVGIATTTFAVHDPQGKELFVYGKTSSATAEVVPTVTKLEQELAQLVAVVDKLRTLAVSVTSVARVVTPPEDMSGTTSSDSIVIATATASSTNKIVAATALVVPPELPWYESFIKLPRLGFDLVRGILP